MWRISFAHKLLSYLWPQTQRISTEHNGVLELTQSSGKWVLDSLNANYSYGSLQKVLERGLKYVELDKVNSILLLGMGGGSIIHSLQQKYRFEGTLDAVEIDRKVIEIARTAFGIMESKQINIIHQDAYDFIEETNQTYDLVIVDLFLDNLIPHQFYTTTFCELVMNRINSEGHLLFNLGMNEESSIQKVLNYFGAYQNLNCTVIKKVQGLNTLLIAQRMD